MPQYVRQWLVALGLSLVSANTLAVDDVSCSDKSNAYWIRATLPPMINGTRPQHVLMIRTGCPPVTVTEYLTGRLRLGYALALSVMATNPQEIIVNVDLQQRRLHGQKVSKVEASDVDMPEVAVKTLSQRVALTAGKPVQVPFGSDIIYLQQISLGE